MDLRKKIQGQLNRNEPVEAKDIQRLLDNPFQISDKNIERFNVLMGKTGLSKKEIMEVCIEYIYTKYYLEPMEDKDLQALRRDFNL